MTRRISVDALENRDGTAVTGDVFVFDDAHADGGKWEAPGAGSASAAWPVGSIFLSAVSTNPATLLGFGTWSAIGAGRVLIGIDSGDVDFDTLGEMGGAKTSSHSHTSGTLTTDTFAAHTHGAGTLLPSAHSGTAVGNHADHVHTAGTLATSAHSGTAVASHGDHTHYINNASSDATISAHSGTAVATHDDHKHEVNKANLPAHAHNILGTNLAHTHPQQIRNTGTAGTAGAQGASTANNATAGTTGSGGPGNIATEIEGNALTCYTLVQVKNSDGTALSLSHSVTQPSNHTLGGKTEGIVTGALTHSVTQPDAHTMSGNTGNVWGGLSSHSVTQPDAHTMSGSTASDGAHGHNVNAGSTGSTASSTVQPYLVVAMWQRTA